MTLKKTVEISLSTAQWAIRALLVVLSRRIIDREPYRNAWKELDHVVRGAEDGPDKPEDSGHTRG